MAENKDSEVISSSQQIGSVLENIAKMPQKKLSGKKH